MKNFNIIILFIFISFLLFNCQQPSSSGGSGGSSDGGDEEKTPTITYKVSYDGNGNVTGIIPASPKSYEEGQLVTILGNTGNLIKTGFQFAGWNTQSDGSGTTYTQGQNFNMGTADITLYAIWTTNPTYTVTYDGNVNTGGTVPVDTTNYQQSQLVIVQGNTGNLVKTGYSFAGWNTQSDGSGTTYTQGQTFNMGTADITLYAIWTANPTYTITYNGNGSTGGTVPVDTTNYQQGQTVTVLDNTGNLEKTGYSFAGWNTLANGSGTTYIQGQTFDMGAVNITLYAKWVVSGTIYTAGNDSSGNACYWIETTKTILETYSVNEPTVYSMMVYNGTVYSAGRDSAGRACYWVGTTKTLLESFGGTAYSLFVYNGIIYTAGIDGSCNVCYWTGTVKTVLEYCNEPLPVTNPPAVRSIFIDNGTIYTAGSDYSDNICYWTGTSKTILGSTSNYYGDANSIFVDNGTVYIAGETENGSACYWIGTTKTALGGKNAYSIVVDNNNIYISGTNSSYQPCYWIGTQQTILDTSYGSGGHASSIKIFNGTIYTGGCDVEGNACYWVGTTKTILDSYSGSGPVPVIWSIFVQ